MRNEICKKCGTCAAEILETGFVGCERCYELPHVKKAVEKMFDGKSQKQNQTLFVCNILCILLEYEYI